MRWDKRFLISWNLFFAIYLIFTRTLLRWMIRILFSATTSTKNNMRVHLMAKVSKTLLKLWLILVNSKTSVTTFLKKMKLITTSSSKRLSAAKNGTKKIMKGKRVKSNQSKFKMNEQSSDFSWLRKDIMNVKSLIFWIVQIQNLLHIEQGKRLMDLKRSGQ